MCQVSQRNLLRIFGSNIRIDKVQLSKYGQRIEMKQLQLFAFLIWLSSVAWADIEFKGYIFPESYASHIGNFIEDLPVINVYEFDDLKLIEIPGYYEDSHDGTAGRLYLADENNKIIDYYESPLGYLVSLYVTGPYIVITDRLYYGGSGGSSDDGQLRIFTVKENKIVPLFDYRISYELNMESDINPDRYGYFSIDPVKKALIVYISKSRMKGFSVIKPIRDFKSNSNLYLTMTNYNVLESQDGSIIFDLTSADDIKNKSEILQMRFR